MKIKTNVKAGNCENGGYESVQHNQTMARALKVKTKVKAGLAGDTGGQHNQTMACGLKVKTGIKAGPAAPPTIRD